MQRYFEIFLVISVIFLIIYSFLYFLFFDWICNSYKWINEESNPFAVQKLASCTDSFVCESQNIETNIKNQLVSWDCVKKESPLFWRDLYLNIYNNFKNSILK